MNNGKVDWKGCFVAVVTPFTSSGEIDEAKFIANLELLISEGIHGLVISGCTGESWALEPEERLRLFKLAVATAKKKVTVVAGTGGISTKKVTELSVAARSAGCDGVMILPPYYAIPGLREVMEHYRYINDNAKTPIMLYNIPRRTGVNMTPEFYNELVKLEWVVAIKESSKEFVQLQDVIGNVGDKVTVLAGHSAERGVPAVVMGCKGYVSSMETQIMGREAISMFELTKAGKLEEAKKIQARTHTLDAALRNAVGTFPANTKTAMNLLGRPGGHVRPPLQDLTSAETARCAEVLRGLGLLAGARAAAE
jgi:4-hydroxy-tetrahydrodipicolinate synthase